MLIIRQEQWDEMQDSLNLEFEDRCLAELRATYPEQLADEDEEMLREDIRNGVEKAKSYDITDDTLVIEFLKFTVEYGREFPYTEKTEWAGEILENPFTTAEEKLTALARRRALDKLDF